MIKIKDKSQLVEFLRQIGTETQFVSMVTETEMVKLKKTPYAGAVKLSRRNGLVNVNFERAVNKRLGGGNDFVAQDTWYRHENNVDGKPLSLCEHRQDTKKKYLQYYPHRTIGKDRYFFGGEILDDNRTKELESMIPPTNKPEWKPEVLVFAIDSIRELKARKVTLKNNTFSRIS